MNFRPTKLKILFGIVFSFLIWFLIFFILKDITDILPEFLVNFGYLYDSLNFFSASNLTLFVIQFVVFYLVFSLIQHKHVKPN